MINKDKYGMAITPEHRGADGGDSTVRNAILKISGEQVPILLHFIKGEPVRHGYQKPWNNPKNFTPDQLIALIAMLISDKRRTSVDYIKKMYRDDIRKIFGYYVRNLFFVDRERDFKGSTKYPWPHKFRNFKKFDEAGREIYFEEYESRSFDFATPVLPDRIGTMILGGNIWYLYWLLPVCIFIHIVALVVHKYSTHNEENQMFFQSYSYGKFFEWLYFKFNTRWNERSKQYWSERDEVEYHDLIARRANAK